MDQTAKAPADLVAPNKHPAGLYVLFFTEMWERFSYYGMRAILVYYMMKQLMFAQDKASHVYGLYTGCVYLTPFFGGMIADRWLGQRKAVVVGGVLMAIGEFMLMSQGLFVPALIMLIIGNGFFKPNISTQVGNLYAAGDHRRDRAFSIFYVGINVGAFFSPFICGTLGEKLGWKWGFCAAGIGMLAGLCLYLWGQKYLAPDNVMKRTAAAKPAEPLTPDEWKKIGALVVLCLLNIVFWGTYEQQGNTLALWVDSNTNRMIFGWEMPATWYQAFNPAMIFLFTPVVLAFWAWQDKRKSEPSSIAKMALGCMLLGLSFLLLIPSARTVAAGGKASLLPLTVCTLVFTIGELYLSPVGLSLVTKLAPPRMVSMLMGMWFLSSFFGNYLCGTIGTFWEKMSHESFFIMLTALACGAGTCMFILIKPLKKAIGHGHEEAVDV
ncbi:MAG TPA: MFS transporter [Elusimicrobia bacterium]|nr:MFS transporter [Elusimicrobiota bacterium]HBT62348.1 MFS transporter [Elusimicrobiota bacterium]